MRRGAIASALAVGAFGLAACGSSNGAPTTAGTPSPGMTTMTAPAPTGSPASAAEVASASTKLGLVLTSSDGHTLYRFDPDKGGTIACTGSCVTTWPPLRSTAVPTAPGGVSGTFGLASRPDGGRQVTFNGSPLYRFVHDTRQGDVRGDGVGGVWHAVRVVAGAPATPTPTPSGGSSGGGGYGGGY